jgi:hypothetical protein
MADQSIAASEKVARASKISKLDTRIQSIVASIRLGRWKDGGKAGGDLV